MVITLISAMYPTAYDLPNILSVASINSSGNLAGSSNYSVNTVDVAAPGVSILSTMSSDSDNCPIPGSYCYVSWSGPRGSTSCNWSCSVDVRDE